MLYKKHALVKIGKICNNNCIGCSISAGENDFIIPTEKVKGELLKIKEAGFESVELIGGEVTIQENFLELLQFTSSLFPEVFLVTNGRMLSYEDYIKKLIKACPGLNIEIALHGHNSKIHDACCTRTPNSFIQALKGVDNVIKYKKYFGTLGINTLITKLNYKNIDKILELIIRLKSVDEWYLLSFVPTEGRAQKNLSTLIVRYKDLLNINDVLLKAYDYLNCIDLNEFPYCLIEADILKTKKDKIHIINSDVVEVDNKGVVCNYNPTFSFNDIDYISNISVAENLNKLKKIHDSFRTKVPACKYCPYSSQCGGLWQKYVDFFGADNANKEIEYLKRLNFPLEAKKNKKKKNILLISVNSMRLIAPLGLVYLKTYAQTSKYVNAHYNIIIESFYEDDFTKAKINQLINETQPAAIGFVLAVWNEQKILTILPEIKKNNPDINIIIGGPQADTRYLDNNPYINFIVIGEGEDSFRYLLDLKFNKTKLAKKNGIAFLQANGKLVFNPKSKELDLNKIPSPFLPNLIDFNEYASYQLIETMRGCPYKCTFCEEPYRFKSVRYFPLDRVKKEFEYILDKSDFLEIIDNNFNLNKKRFREICVYLSDLQKKYKEKKKIAAALNYHFIDRAQVNLLKKAGITKVELGLQTTNPKAYKNLNRFPLNLKRFKNVVGLFDKNFEIIVDIILGLPGDNLVGFCKTIDFLMSKCKTKAKLEINCEHLKILPKSSLSQKTDLYNIDYKKTAPYLEIANSTFSSREILMARDIAKRYC